MSKTASVRLSESLYTRIDDHCVTNDCTRNDFIKNAIENALKPKPAKIVNWTLYDDDGNVIASSENS